MIPRSTNPHFLPQAAELVVRADIYSQQHSYNPPDEQRLAEFSELMKRSFPVELQQQNLDDGRVRKRRKVRDEGDSTARVEEPILFRLVSNAPPVLLSLQPKPPPTLKVREPEMEDSKAQALERHEKAVAVAVDGESIVRESLTPSHQPFRRQPVFTLTVPFVLSQPPAVMVLCHDKPLRNTRPPVDPNDLGYPYKSFVRPEALSVTARCPVFDMDRILEDSSQGTTKRRRRRRRRKAKPTENATSRILKA